MTEHTEEAPTAVPGSHACSGGEAVVPASSSEPVEGDSCPASKSVEEKEGADKGGAQVGLLLERGASGAPLHLGAPLTQRVAVRFMQGRRGVQEDRHVVIPDLKEVAEPSAQREMEAWGTSPTALVALFDGHRGVSCSDFCASAFCLKLTELLCRKLPEQVVGATKQPEVRVPAAEGAPQSAGAPSPSAGEQERSAEARRGPLPPLIRLSAASFTSPAPKEPLLTACCCPLLRGLLPALPEELQRLMPSLYHRLFSAFKQVDKEFLSKYKIKATAGCTAVALLTLGRLGVVCWVGDSRAVAGVRRGEVGGAPSFRGGPPLSPHGAPSEAGAEEGCEAGKQHLVAMRLTEDHKPNRPDEKARIEKAGGHVLVVGGVARVAPSDYQERTKRMKHEQCTMGGATQQPSTLMAVSRSFGDRDLKAEGLISATPEVVLLPLTEDVLFIVLACDGVWDALSDQAVVDIVGAHLNDPDEATSKVVKAAFDKGSQDNLTAMLVVFDTP